MIEYNEYINRIIKNISNDRESYLQLILSISNKNVYNRIKNCPTYPLVINTNDLNLNKTTLLNLLNNYPELVSYILSQLYSYSNKIEHRKKYGQYFTPINVANKVLNYLNIEKDDNIIDAGCGTGIFATQLINILNKNFDVSKITYLGIENDPLLALSAAFSLEYINAPSSWIILYANFLDINKKNIYNLGLSKIDKIISNPPYVRYHNIVGKKKYKKKYNIQSISSLSGLHTYFIRQSSDILDGNKMVFILPLEMLNSNYGKNILNYMKNDYLMVNKILYIETNDDEIKEIDIQNYSINDLLSNREQWNIIIFERKNTKKYVQNKNKYKKIINDYTPLSSFINVHRGISTGANDYFILDEKTINKMKLKNYLLKIMPTKTIRKNIPDILTKKEWEQYNEDNKKCWLLYLDPNNKYEEFPNKIKRYIEIGEKKRIHLRWTCRNRKPWYSVKIRDPPDIFFTYISRGLPKFIYNKAKVHILTNLLGLYLKDNIILSKDELNELTVILNISIKKWIESESIGRKYSGGLIKFEPNDLMKMPIESESLINLGIISTIKYFI